MEEASDRMEGVPLPRPAPQLLEPPEDERGRLERLYFDPAKWDAELVSHRTADENDPVAVGKGKLEGQAKAALFISDFHMADGTAGGDDFLESHLHPEKDVGGLYTGFFPPGESRAEV